MVVIGCISACFKCISTLIGSYKGSGWDVCKEAHFLLRHGPHERGTRFLFRMILYWPSGVCALPFDELFDGAGLDIFILGILFLTLSQ